MDLTVDRHFFGAGLNHRRRVRAEVWCRRWRSRGHLMAVTLKSKVGVWHVTVAGNRYMLQLMYSVTGWLSAFGAQMPPGFSQVSNIYTPKLQKIQKPNSVLTVVLARQWERGVSEPRRPKLCLSYRNLRYHPVSDRIEYGLVSRPHHPLVYRDRLSTFTHLQSCILHSIFHLPLS